jgi:outer membrane protein assembly factor BamE (lipoprotein component of BamABCDE complex)
MQRTMKSTLIAAVAALALGACTPIVAQHGFIPDNELVERVKTGVHTRSQVAEILGAPSSVASFNGETWYYITRRTETVAFLKPKVTDQRVVAVSFDPDNGLVAEVRRFSVEDGRDVAFVERETPTRGKELGFVEQLLGNVGRFSDEGRTPSRGRGR